MYDGLQSHTKIPKKNLPFFTFYIKVGKPVKAIIRHLPGNIPAEDITVALQKLGYDIISIVQMTTKQPTLERGSQTLHSLSS
jgi:hypothetical protein